MTIAAQKITEGAGRSGRTPLCLLKRLLLLPQSLLLVRSDFGGGDDRGRVRILYIGEGLSLEYYRRLFGSPPGQSGRIPIWKLQRALEEARAGWDVVLVEINRLAAFLLPKGGLFADAWVRQETDLTGDRYKRRLRGIERGWGQKVRRQKFSCRRSSSAADLATFYSDYYVPYVSQRHGPDSSIRSCAELRRAVKSGFLLQVWRETEWVSGVVASCKRGDRVRLLAAGVQPPHLTTLRQGALSAAYYFLFRWAGESGIRIVDFCGTRPHLLNGVFRHKSLWAAEPRHDPWHHTVIAFYLAHDKPLPETITHQLVNRAGGFATIGECLAEGRSRG